MKASQVAKSSFQSAASFSKAAKALGQWLEEPKAIIRAPWE